LNIGFKTIRKNLIALIYFAINDKKQLKYIIVLKYGMQDNFKNVKKLKIALNRKGLKNYF
jgi:hypothetical protein